jgi:hypothetical protein
MDAKIGILSGLIILIFVLLQSARAELSQNDGRNENRIGRLFQASCMDAGYFNFEIWDDIIIM